MDLTKSLKEIFKYGVIYMLGWAFNTVIRIALLPVYTRYLNSDQYGTISMLDSAISLIQILCSFGLGSAILRFFHEYQDTEKQRRVIATGLSITLLMLLLTGGSFYPFSVNITNCVLGEGSNPDFFRLALATMLLGVLKIGVDSYFMAFKYARTIVLSNSVQILLNVGINLYLIVVLKMGVMGMLIGNLISNAIVILIMFLYVVRINSLAVDWGIMKGMVKYGLPFVPSLMAAAGMHNLDRFFIRIYAGLDEVGLYSLAYQFPFMLNTIFVYAFGQIWSGSTMYSVARSPDATYQFARVCTYYMTVLAVAMFAISVSAETIISIFAAPSYFDAYRYLPVVALGIWGYALHTFVKIGVELTKKTYLFTISYIMALVINVILNYLLVPRWGAMGAAWATLLTYFCFSIFGYLVYRHCYPIKLEWGRLAKLLLLAVGLYYGRQFIPVHGFWGELAVNAAFVSLYILLLLFAINFFTSGEKAKFRMIVGPVFAAKLWGKNL